MDLSAEFWITHLKLVKHPEGGNYREIYRSALKCQIGDAVGGHRNAGTSIYFLLEKNQFSAFHKISFDELWHFYAGSALEIFEIESETGLLVRHMLGPNPQLGEEFQRVIRGGNWFAARPIGATFSLVGCTVAPGFEFPDFELAARQFLLEAYPQHSALILSLTR